MKKIFAMIFPLLATTAFAETEKADSVVSFRDVESVVIYDNDKSINVELRGKKDDKDFRYTYTQEVTDTAKLKVEHVKNGVLCRNTSLGCISNDAPVSHEIACGLGFGLGFVGGLNTPNSVSINPMQSVELSFNDLVSYRLSSIKSRHGLSVGFGLTWRNFFMTDDKRFFKTPEGNIIVGDCAENQELNSSRLKVFSLSVPVLWHYKYATKQVTKGVNNYKLLFGPIVNFNTFSSMKTRYKQDGKDVEESNKIGCRTPVTVDIYGAIELVEGVGFYVRYSPMSMFKTAHAPKICPLSMGLRVGF